MFHPRKRRERAYMWRDELAKYVYSQTLEVTGWKAGEAPAGTPPPRATGATAFANAVTRLASGWKSVKAGDYLGPVDRFIWLTGAVEIPKDFAGGEVVFRIDVGREGELFGHTGVLFVDGVESAGLDRQHKELLLAKRAKGGERFSIAVQAYTGPVDSFAIREFGSTRRFLSGPTFGGAGVNLVNHDAFRLYHDMNSAVDIFAAMREGSHEELEIVAAVSDAINLVDLKAEPKKRDASFRAASALLAERVFEGRKGDAAGTVHCIAQSHIDLAWLWPTRETQLKCAATMANTLMLEDRYPFYNFCNSQAQGFQWIKDLYPNLHERLKAAVKSGRLELVGGMWVEADLNCAGGEALARQFLYGQRFFRGEFGVYSRVGWLIDTFGFSWAMPQILKESELDYFVSTKPTWCDTNTFPFTTFWWESPDGSRVLTHVPPHSYGGDMTAKRLTEALDMNKEARSGIGPLYLYGKSDGGGGPRVSDIEAWQRISESPYTPKLDSTTPIRYLDAIPRDYNWPVYCDEMYVETHRGTYTSQARTKRNNRKSECDLFATEAVSTAAMILGADYPQAEIEAAWKLALLNQFHDILPGSSIGMVYVDAEADYARVFETTRRLTGDALGFIASKVDTTGEGQAHLIFNASAWERTEVVELDAPRGACHAVDAMGAQIPSQRASDGRHIAALVTVPSCGWTVVRVAAGAGEEEAPLAKARARTFRDAVLHAAAQPRRADRAPLRQGRWPGGDR